MSATEMQREMLAIALRLGVDLKDVEAAIALVRSGRVDLIVKVTCKDLTLRAALKAARSEKPNDHRS